MNKTPWNPSRKATARVRDPLPAPTHCPFCGADVGIVHHDDLYGRAYSDWPWVYRCTDSECDSHVGMHPFTNIPLGTLANAKTRAARKACKPAFERLWLGRDAKMNRADAYAALAKELGIPRRGCHFAWFDADMCEAAVAASDRILERNRGGLFQGLRALLKNAKRGDT